ncbi:hypothetical protein QBC45DRAFT_467716 [Copromyces sp. CBS 386.78]|nr:hypothetical protein QBC45DRAFT_467716 [Copromyces sp. CBS 386.78]
MMESSEAFDTSHVREKFSGLADELVNRLGRALSKRRQYFMYREEHFNRLAEGLTTGVESEDPNLEEQATTVASSVPRHLEAQIKSMSDPQDLYAASYDDINSISEISTTSYAASEANPDQPRVPPMPKEHANGPFKCPFCHSIELAKNRHDWKKHVFRDLQPYVYGEMHTAEKFQEHTSNAHGNEVSREHTSDLVRLCSFSDPTKARGDCLFCDQRLTLDKLYISHVALHLEQLALFALPSVEYDQDDEDEQEEHDDSDGYNQDDAKESTNEDNEDSEGDNELAVEASLPGSDDRLRQRF